jgi:hypothetical protein
MPNEWLIKDFSAAYVIFRWRPLTEEEKAVEFLPSSPLLTSWLDNLSMRAAVREMYESAFGKSAGNLDYARKRDIVQQLESAFHRRILVCLRVTRVTPGANSQKDDDAPPPPAPAPPPPRPVKNKTWIGIELVDDKGKPVPGEQYRIVLPDGSQEEDRLDAQGRAHINNIDPGECQISFPNVDAREWGPA